MADRATSNKSGFVAVIGRPNAGKSTLLNSLLGEKLVIVSDKPQTTRNKITCILTRPDAQIIFLDTPGLHKPKTKLGEYMVGTAQSAYKEVDVVLLLIDAAVSIGAGDRYVVESLREIQTPVLLALNKTDLVSAEHTAELTATYRDWFPFAGIIPVSALRQTNLPALLAAIIGLLPEGPRYYPEDMVIDQPERFIVAELIREKAMQLTNEEVPHAVAVDIEEMATRENDMVFIRAVLYAEKDSQKGIIIGAGGTKLKEIGRRARQDIENLLGSKIYLDLWVKVKKDWRKREKALRQFGYE
ncbi:MAG: GTPase Era [bacterium]|jgi:GTP-binding protein Era